MSELVLQCECGGFGSLHTFRGPDDKAVNMAAYHAGWGLHKGKQVCPTCKQKIMLKLAKAAKKRREMPV
jgi:hypothetical protein